MTEKNKGGRPRLYSSVEEMQKDIDNYFKACDEKLSHVDKDGNKFYGEPYTITGLALALNMTRKVLIDYEKRGEFCNAVKIAKTKCENYAEKRLFGTSPTGAIFALKNYGWVDTQENINHNREVEKREDGKLIDKDYEIVKRFEEKILTRGEKNSKL